MNLSNLSQTVTVLFVLLAAAVQLAAQNSFTLQSSTVDGGGGACLGGKFKLSGTAGQPDAGVSTGGSYVQQGGFMAASQTLVGPAVSAMPSGDTLLLSWSVNACTGFRLEGSANVTAGPWIDLGEGLLVGPNRQVAVARSSGYGFFRLRKDCPTGCSNNCTR